MVGIYSFLNRKYTIYDKYNYTMNEIQLKKLVDEGLSTHKIADKFNTSQTTIVYWLRKYKLKTNPLKSGVTKVICLN